jgi:hypothetical protein
MGNLGKFEIKRVLRNWGKMDFEKQEKFIAKKWNSGKFWKTKKFWEKGKFWEKVKNLVNWGF